MEEGQASRYLSALSASYLRDERGPTGNLEGLSSSIGFLYLVEDGAGSRLCLGSASGPVFGTGNFNRAVFGSGKDDRFVEDFSSDGVTDAAAPFGLQTSSVGSVHMASHRLPSFDRALCSSRASFFQIRSMRARRSSLQLGSKPPRPPSSLFITGVKSAFLE